MSPSLTYNDMLGAYASYPAPIRPYLLRAETHPQLTPLLTKSFMRVFIDLLARAPIKDPLRPLKLRVDVVARDLGISTKTVGRALSFMQQQGWLFFHHNQYGRNHFGEFGAREFFLSEELRTLLGLPTSSLPLAPAKEEKSKENPSLSMAPLAQENAPVAVDNATTETKMSHGTYRVNKVFKKEASFQKEASELKTHKTEKSVDQTPEPNSPSTPSTSVPIKPVKLPDDLGDMAKELDLNTFGVFALIRLAKQCKQRLQDVWKVKRDQLLNAGVKQGRAYRYIEFLLKTGEDFAFRARNMLSGNMQSNSSNKQKVVKKQGEDIRHYWNKKYTDGMQSVCIHGDGSGEIYRGSVYVSYVCPKDMRAIYDAIQGNRLKLVKE